jgi:hypothetical protein
MIGANLEFFVGPIPPPAQAAARGKIADVTLEAGWLSSQPALLDWIRIWIMTVWFRRGPVR